MPDDLMDQAMIPPDQWHTMLFDIDRMAMDARNQQDDTEIVQFCRSLIEGMQLRGVTLAKLLFEWKRVAPDCGIDPKDWEDYARAKTGKSIVTIRKYVDLWENVFEKVDPRTFWYLLGKPIQGLLLLPAAVREGQLDDHAWREIVDATDAAEIRDVVRRVRGEATSSGSAIQIVLDRNGVLMAYRGEDQVGIGYLNYGVDSDVGRAAVERIISEARIRRS